MSRRCRTVMGTLCALSVITLGPAVSVTWSQTTWYVDDDAPNDPGPGDPAVSDPDEDGSAAHPFDAIQEGIDVASDGDEVVVHDGTYTGPGNRDLDYGGRLIMVRSENSPENCVIDCEAAGRGFYLHSFETDAAVVEGFTIENASAGYGGGIYCFDSSPTVRNCVITGTVGGSGIATQRSNMVIAGCTIADNPSGGLQFGNSSASVSNCTITANTWFGVSCGGWYMGESPSLTDCLITNNPDHGLTCGASDPTVTDCDVSNNGEDGLVCFTGSCAVVSDCMFSDNDGYGIRCGDGSAPTVTGCTVCGSGDRGVYCYGSSSPTIGHCIIVANRGGVNCGVGCDATIVNCAVVNNSASDRGGGIRVGDDAATIANCLIAGNSTTSPGGGLSVRAADAAIVNCTIMGNTSSDKGGGVHCEGYEDPVFANCILWDNSAPQGCEIAVTGSYSIFTVSYSDVDGGAAAAYVEDGCTLNWGDGNLDGDPLFIDPDGLDDDSDTWEDNDYHLLPGSPCIDAGDNDVVLENVTTDLDGNARFVDDADTDDTGHGTPPIVDMGAYEYQAVIPGDLNGDGCVNQSDLGILLADWGCSGGGCSGDCDFDGDSDQSDLGILLAHWGEGCP